MLERSKNPGRTGMTTMVAARIASCTTSQVVGAVSMNTPSVDAMPVSRSSSRAFLIAGLDTVTDSLDCFFVYLAQHPDHRHQLVEQPDVLPRAIEELLRWETPVPGVARVAMQDVEVGGCPINKGERVSPLLGAANTDPAEFPDPELVDFRRNPNRHRAFGGGPHRCLGSHLARMELRVAMREFHRRIPDYEIKPGTELTYTAALRSVESLPLIFPVATS